MGALGVVLVDEVLNGCTGGDWVSVALQANCSVLQGQVVPLQSAVRFRVPVGCADLLDPQLLEEPLELPGDELGPVVVQQAQPVLQA